MGQIKNIKLHIVTDIKVRIIKECNLKRPLLKGKRRAEVS